MQFIKRGWVGGGGEKQEGKKRINFFPKLKRHKRRQPLRPIWPFT